MLYYCAIGFVIDGAAATAAFTELLLFVLILISYIDFYD